MMTLDLNAIAQLSATRIVDCLIEGTLIAAFADLTLRVIRRQGANARFAVWFAALMAIAATPLFGGSWWAHGGSNSAESVSRTAITLPGSWAPYFFGVWAVIAGWALVRVGLGLWHVHELRRNCVPVNRDALDSRLRETLLRNRTNRAVDLCVSDQVNVPTAIGLVRPAVVIPRWVMQELSPVELNQILLHELAHLRRWDDWTNLAQKVVKALFFFHPAVWWIENRVSLEREMACDDAVVGETASPRAYAECLAHLAEKTLFRRTVALAQAVLGGMRQTSQRVAQILDMNRPAKSTHSWKLATSLVAGFAMVCVVGVSRAPRLIAFGDSMSKSTATPAIIALSSSSGSGGVAEVAPSSDAQVSKVVYRRRPARVVHATEKRMDAMAANRRSENIETASAIEHPGVGSMIRLASFTSAVATTEAVFVVVEGREFGPADQSVYQIRVWRLVVLRPVVEPVSTKIPRKET